MCRLLVVAQNRYYTGLIYEKQAATRFCVAVSTAGNWDHLWRLAGSASRAGKVARAARDGSSHPQSHQPLDDEDQFHMPSP